MTFSFEPTLQLVGTPAVLVRSLDDATRVLREYTGHRPATRDSILLTYFVDAGALKILRNRGKRLGNFILNEYRHRFG